MGWYGEWVFPRLLDWSMAGQPFADYRRQLLAPVKGDVLEIGFGTGLNLAYYPDTVTSLTVIDPNPGMAAIAQPRLQRTALKCQSRPLRGERLDFPAHQFDWVVSTWTLCSIADRDRALAEIHRVLKPGGRFAFIEHGLSPDPAIARWQTRLTPLQKRLADGCRLDQPIADLIRRHFDLDTLVTEYAPNLPKTGGYFYRGVAVK
ncbi:MAG: class I SAM-dependent methyltransferase [Cyanobacteria bacterium]|nr:class I SAM-dependent methyltransferase [Cyanobacteriota bacterium]